METGAHSCQPTPKRRRIASGSATSDRVSFLLEDELFLLMVFEHLVDYGLHDCRLVCRRWYAVCQQFPLQLKNVTGDHLEMIGAFPNTTSVSVTQPIAAIEFSANLVPLRNLKSLSIESGCLFNDLTDTVFFEPMTQLVDLRLECLISDPADTMIASIKYLTNLTRLAVYSGPWISTPVTFLELKKIRELDVCLCHFLDKRGVCLFPSLTSLTRLELSGFQTRNQAPVISLEVSTLTVSEICMTSRCVLNRESVSMLPLLNT